MHERKFLVVFASASIVFAIIFLAIFAIFFAKSSNEKENLGYYKGMGTQIHNDIQNILKEAKAMLPSTGDINLENPDERMKLNIHLSLLDDLAWIANQENANYEKLMNASSYEETVIYAKKGIACSVVAQYILLLNTLFDESELKLPEEQTQQKYTEAAKKLLQSPEKLKISTEVLEGFREDFGLKVEKVQADIDELFAAYIEHLASKFRLANTTENRERTYIEAKKIVTIAQY